MADPAPVIAAVVCPNPACPRRGQHHAVHADTVLPVLDVGDELDAAYAEAQAVAPVLDLADEMTAEVATADAAPGSINAAICAAYTVASGLIRQAARQDGGETA